MTACGGYSTTTPVPDEGTADLVSSDVEVDVSTDTSIQDTTVKDTAVEDTTVLDTTPPKDTSLPPSDGLWVQRVKARQTAPQTTRVSLVTAPNRARRMASRFLMRV